MTAIPWRHGEGGLEETPFCNVPSQSAVTELTASETGPSEPLWCVFSGEVSSRPCVCVPYLWQQAA